MGTDVIVGIDVGTTRVKAIAVDERGAVRGGAERPTPWRRQDGRTEADPLALVRLARTVAAESVTATGGRALAIGLTGMAETGVLADGHDRPLAPAIAWHDPRGDVETIARELGADTFPTTTGMPLSQLPSLAKLLWLRRTDPGTAGAARFYSVGEWVVRGLGGDPVAELSLASRTGLLDLATGLPWEAAHDLLGVPGLLPPPVPAGTPAGRAHGDDLPGVLRGAVLTVAGHDHQVAAYGVGAAGDDAMFDSLGTAEALVRSVRPPLAPEHVAALTALRMTVGWGVVPGQLNILAGLPTGLTLTRIATMVGAATEAERMALAEQAMAEPADPAAPRLVEPRDEGFGLAGIADGVTPPRLWRAAVHGMVAEADRLLTVVDGIAGPHGRVVAAGGWLHDPVLLAAKRRRFPGLRIASVAEPGAYGAALLAASAAGLPLSPPPVTSPVSP